MAGQPISSESYLAAKIEERARKCGGGGYVALTWSPVRYGGRPGVQWQASVALLAPRRKGRYSTAWSTSPLSALNLLDRVTTDEARALGVEPAEEVAAP
jgi:hypothetical protein